MRPLPRPLQAACWRFSACRPTSREENAGLSRRGVDRNPAFCSRTVIPALNVSAVQQLASHIFLPIGRKYGSITVLVN